jgi:hypothetical protein
MQCGDQCPELHGGGEGWRGNIVADSGIHRHCDVAVSSSAVYVDDGLEDCGLNTHTAVDLHQ